MKQIFRQAIVLQVLKFSFVGGLVLVVFITLNKLLGLWMSPTAAFLLAYPPAVALHFVLNKKWTFGSRRQDTGQQVGEYIGVVLLTFLIQLGVFRLALTVLDWHPLVSAAVANISQMAVGFVMYSRRVFISRAAGS